MDAIRSCVREIAALAAVVGVVILASQNVISGDAAAAILGGVAGAGVASAAGTVAHKRATT